MWCSRRFLESGYTPAKGLVGGKELQAILIDSKRLCGSVDAFQGLPPHCVRRFLWVELRRSFELGNCVGVPTGINEHLPPVIPTFGEGIEQRHRSGKRGIGIVPLPEEAQRPAQGGIGV